jgi:hypothetical protein
VPVPNTASDWVLLVRSEVLTAVTMKKAVYWDVTPCGVSEERIASIIRVKGICELETKLALTSSSQIPRNVPPIRRFLQGQHGVTSPKTAFFWVLLVENSTAVRHNTSTIAGGHMTVVDSGNKQITAILHVRKHDV